MALSDEKTKIPKITILEKTHEIPTNIYRQIRVKKSRRESQAKKTPNFPIWDFIYFATQLSEYGSLMLIL
jgi:hypothetical protein